MLRVKFSKLKQVCATAFIPNIVKETRMVKKDINKCYIDYFSKAIHKKYKSSDSCSKDGNSSSRQAIIDKCFSEKPLILHEEDLRASLLSKERVNLTTEDTSGAAISTLIVKEKIDDKIRNAEVQKIAAKIEEVKLIHDSIYTAKSLHGIDKDRSFVLENNDEKNDIEKGKQEHNSVPIDSIPQTKIDGVEGSALLPHANIQTTTENIMNHQKLTQSIVHIDKTPRIGEVQALQKAGPSTTKMETDKLAELIVQINKSPMADIFNIQDNHFKLTNSNDFKISASEVKEHNNINKDFEDISKLENTHVQMTTGKIEEEKLAQKIDNIDETPHVEATPGKIEGFNVSPKILGHDTTCNSAVSEVKHNFIGHSESIALDEFAKNYIGKPPDEVDKMLLKEMRNISSQSKHDFPGYDSSCKYFSRNLQDKTTDHKNIVLKISDTKVSSDKEVKLDNFYPFYLGTVPIVTSDTVRYDDALFKSCLYKKSKNEGLDFPAVLDSYGVHAIPFYKYFSKTNVILNDATVQKSSPVKAINKTEMKSPINNKVILTIEEIKIIHEPHLKDLDKEHIQGSATVLSNIEASTVDASRLADSIAKPSLFKADVFKLLEYKNTLTAQHEVIENMSPKINVKEISTISTKSPSAVKESATVLTLDTPLPTDGYANQMGDSEQSISPERGQNQQSANDQPDTAISSHQNADEYFPTNHINTFMGIDNPKWENKITDCSVTYTGVFDLSTGCYNATDLSTVDNLISQNMSCYSTFPHLSDLLKNSKDDPDQTKHLDEKNHFTNVLTQLELKQGFTEKQFIRPNEIKKEFCKDIIQARSIATENISLDKETDLSDETVPLSILLKRVRERSHLELLKSVKSEPKVAKNPACNPPLDKSKPKTNPSPPPCQPKPKEKEQCPSPCKPPQKKDPCAKLVPVLLHTIFNRSNVNISIPVMTRYDEMNTYLSLFKMITYDKVKRLCYLFDFLNFKNNEDEVIDVAYARDFNPWVPIPSWPIQQVEKKQPFTCPREGCKYPVHPTRSNTDKPFLGMPKKISPTSR